MTHLKELRLYYCFEVGDEGVVHLLNLPSLEALDVCGTKITEAGVERLRVCLPGLTTFYHNFDDKDEEGDY